eukprot:CAMPEP_0118653016 /NCGR_PEP_ID=MMETSP0785-20121206/11617_1 /TAXON_ID=91992 /ORGANISM="Bolidomonas pacifica, Strain CCMP 1866" /LENGTH=541 /DNA_ID=CAMNT_0006545553 /DNA_START=145 /DNA_END=1767 /DNA_ORIENTATION=-
MAASTLILLTLFTLSTSFTLNPSSSTLISALRSSKVEETDVLVIGSGISGSCLSFHLARNHGVDSVIMAERNAEVGGNVISKSIVDEDGEFVWEEGPNSFQPTPAIVKTAYELGIADELVLADGSLPRFVYWEGEGAGSKLANLHALPTNLPGDLLTFNLLTWPGKIRAGLGAVGLIKPPPEEPYEESIREFVTRHLGKETFERVIDPFVSGVYAGDPDELAMRSALKKIHRLEGLGDFGPGLVSGAVNRFKEIADEKASNPPDPAWPTYKSGELGSFRRGLQTLPKAVEKYLGKDRVRLEHTLKSLEREGDDGAFVATFDTPEGDKVIKAKSVSLTSPTATTSKVASNLVPEASRLSEVYSPPVASVTIAYPKSSFKELPGGTSSKPLRGFGHLLPRKMGIRSLGTIWSSSLFPNRAPEGWELLLTYIGGARDKGIKDMTEEEIVERVNKDVKKVLLKDGAEDGKLLGCRVWPVAIPQYRRGHKEILDQLEEGESKVPGLYLGGNYRTGVAFGDCVGFGVNEAEKISRYLKNMGAKGVKV